MTKSNPKLGIILMILISFLFACQDAVTRHLATHYEILTIVMIRYWVFAIFVIVISTQKKGGLRQVMKTDQMGLHILRGLLLLGEIIVMVIAFVTLGLIETHTVFAIYPIILALLAGPILGEYIGWRRGIAVMVGFLGVVIILRPGLGVFSPEALIPLLAAFMFALYGILTRKAARRDSPATSFFYAGISGAICISLIGPFWWTPISDPFDMMWMGVLCALSLLAHFLLIQAYAIADAATLQPFAYFQLVFVTIIGVGLFDERIDAVTMSGAALILSAGLYTTLRANWKSRAHQS